MIKLRTVKCCATCQHYQGWFDNMFCGKNNGEIRPYFICDYHKPYSKINGTEDKNNT